MESPSLCTVVREKLATKSFEQRLEESEGVIPGKSIPGRANHKYKNPKWTHHESDVSEDLEGDQSVCNCVIKSEERRRDQRDSGRPK